ncbi:MAG: hypothetical protein HY602_03445 [Parcubacteria group bacterium]|nr:hypothetical protein [Parcubacteria group bacterium]
MKEKTERTEMPELNREFEAKAVHARTSLFRMQTVGTAVLAFVTVIALVIDKHFLTIDTWLSFLRSMMALGIPGMALMFGFFIVVEAIHRLGERYGTRSVVGSIVVVVVITLLTALLTHLCLSRHIEKTVAYLATYVVIAAFMYSRSMNLWTMGTVTGMAEGVLVYFTVIYKNDEFLRLLPF